MLKKQAKEAIGTLLFIHLLSGEGFDRRILVLISLWIWGFRRLIAFVDFELASTCIQDRAAVLIYMNFEFSKISVLKIYDKDFLIMKSNLFLDRIKGESENEKDANKYFFIMKMALDIRNNKLMVQVLSYIQVSTRLFHLLRVVRIR